jgi:hypothetical protein
MKKAELLARKARSTDFCMGVLPSFSLTSSVNKKNSVGWVQCLTPIILATEEAEIRRSHFEASLGKKSE